MNLCSVYSDILYAFIMFYKSQIFINLSTEKYYRGQSNRNDNSKDIIWQYRNSCIDFVNITLYTTREKCTIEHELCNDRIII